MTAIKRFFSWSNWVILLIAIFWLSVMGINKPWNRNQITNDVISYYSYLPATFIYHDLTLKFVASDPFFGDKFWPKDAPNGGKVIKMSSGLSILYSPFFFLGHIVAPLFHEPRDGFSTPYQVCLNLSSLFYLLLGLYYLRKLLLMFFSEGITALTLLSVFFGTNLMWYSTVDGLMSHGYLFCLFSAFAYHTVQWHNQPTMRKSCYIGLVGGLMTLVRPTLIICMLFFVLYGVYNKVTSRRKFNLIKEQYKKIVIICACFILVQIPQLLYWKYVTGDWLFFSYIGERFYFDNPHIVEGLLGFRKGWLIYTPIMFFAIIGLFFLRRDLKVFTAAIIIPLVISIYVIFSWWCWWYGGSFGQRPMVDFYGILALPMAGVYRSIYLHGKRIARILMSVIVTLLIALNLFQTKQFNDGLIHYDSMTKEAYFSGFFASHPTVEWYESLEDPDYDRLVKGYPEKITLNELLNLQPGEKISLKAANLKSVSCEIGSTLELDATRYERNAWERFTLVHLEGNKIALKADNGKYVSADRSLGWKLIGNRDAIGAWETFELVFLGNNRIALLADNKKYVSVGPEPSFTLIANGDTLTKKEQFRVYISYRK